MNRDWSVPPQQRQEESENRRRATLQLLDKARDVLRFYEWHNKGERCVDERGEPSNPTALASFSNANCSVRLDGAIDVAACELSKDAEWAIHALPGDFARFHIKETARLELDKASGEHRHYLIYETDVAQCKADINELVDKARKEVKSGLAA